MTNFEKVKEFHEAFGLSQSSNIHDFDLIELRLSLLSEEYNEVLNETVDCEIDVKRLSKELADLLYVTYGFGASLGLQMDKIFEEVHRSNMSKLGDDGKPVYREDGKVMKGLNYKPPNLEGLI